MGEAEDVAHLEKQTGTELSNYAFNEEMGCDETNGDEQVHEML